MSVKQVIVMRTDLNMRKGKMCAQAAHASMKVFFDRLTLSGMNTYSMAITSEMNEWVTGLFTKIVVGVESEGQLLLLHEQVKAAELPVALIVDAGLTEFHGVPTPTALAIGPAKSEDINVFTKELKLL